MPIGSSPRLNRAATPAAPWRKRHWKSWSRWGRGRPLVEALPWTTAEKRETLAYVEALSRLIDAKTLPQPLKTMRRQRPGDLWNRLLSSSKNYPASALLDALAKPSMPKQAILDVIAAHKARFTVRELLNAAYNQEPSERAGLFKVIAELPTNLRSTIWSPDRGQGPGRPAAHHQCAGTLQHAQSAAGRADAAYDNSTIRSAALSALARMDGPFDMTLLCGMLRDPEIEVQNKAVDVVIHANHPETVKYLVEVLKDENEYARARLSRC